jgi:hypothetical protein
MNVCFRHGDFLFTYILWFEDSLGNQRQVKDTNAFVTEFPESPGILGSYFYRYFLPTAPELLNSLFQRPEQRRINF